MSRNTVLRICKRACELIAAERCGHSTALVVALWLAAGWAHGQLTASGSPQVPQRHSETLPAYADLPLSSLPALSAKVDVSGPAPSRPPAPEVDEALTRRRAAALEHLNAGRFAQAVAELDGALSIAPQTDYELTYLLARAKLALGHLGEARVAAEHAVQLRPEAVEARLLLARLHQRQGRSAAALDEYRAATSASADAGDSAALSVAWFELAEALEQAGYLRAAAEAYEQFDRRVWQAYPRQREDQEIGGILQRYPHGTIERRVELLGRLNRWKEAVAAAAEVLAERPPEPYLQRLYAQTLCAAGRQAEAFVFCSQQLQQAPAAGATATFDALASLLIETGRTTGQLSEWLTELAAQVRAGAAAELGRRLAARLDAAGAYDHSIDLWRALLERQPADAEARWALAGALRAAGDLRAALDTLIEFLRRGLSGTEVGDAATLLPVEHLAAWMRSFDATQDFLKLVNELSADPHADGPTFAVLGMTAAAGGQIELAERLFTIALEKCPELIVVRLAWARMLLAAYRWEEALAQTQAALERAPDDPVAHFLRAEAFAGLDRHSEAEAEYKAALDKKPDDASLALAVARHYRRTGNLLAAQRYLQQAWSLNRNLGSALEDLIDCYLEAGKFEVARACLREAESADVPPDILRRVRTVLRFAAAPMQSEHLAELAWQFEQYPDDALTGLKLAAGLYLAQRPAEALRVAERVQALLPDDERVAYLLAQIHLRRLEHEQAIAKLRELVRRYPRRVQALRLLADAYLADFQVEEARDVLRRLLELDLPAEQRDQFRANLLGSYLEFAEFDAALALLEEWIAADPQSDDWARAKLRVLLTARRESEAVAWASLRLEPITTRFEELRRRAQALAERLRATPDDADLQARLRNLERELNEVAETLSERRAEWVQVALEAERYGTVERQVRVWLAEQPNQPEVQEWLVNTLLASKQGAAALETLEKFVPQDAGQAIATRLLRARCLAATGQLDAGVNDLLDLLSEGYIQDTAAARLQLQHEVLSLLIEQRQFDRALELCRHWLKGVPENDVARRYGVLSLQRLVLGAAGREREQEEVLMALLAMQPHDPGLNNDLGYTWADRGQNLERALEMVRLAVAAEPLNAAYLDSLGWVYYKLGDFAAAGRYLTRAARLRSGQDAVIYDHLGDAQYRAGNPQAAKASWEKAVTLLSTPEAQEEAPQNAQRLADLRAKLAALQQNLAPKVAPIGEESVIPAEDVP